MGVLFRSLVLCVCVIVPVAASAAPITSNFNSTLEGWTAIDTVGGTPAQVATGGNPGGYLFADNAESSWTYVIAPSAFLGNLSAFNGGAFSFDGNQLTGTGLYGHGTGNNGPNFNAYGRVIFTGTSGSADLDFAPAAVPVGQWVTYSMPLIAAAWAKTNVEWTALLADVTDIRISLEGTFGSETNGFDNPTLTPSAPAIVPEPDSLTLFGIGIAAFVAWRLRP